MLSSIKLPEFKAKNNEGKILKLPIDEIKPNPYQPRKFFDEDSLIELAYSIKEVGLIQPISVRQKGPNEYELIAGERRLRAAYLAGFTEIPAIIVNVESKDSAFFALVENLQRQNLNYFEEALGFQKIMKDYGLTQEELAEKLGKSQSAIANKIRLLKFSDEIRQMIMENGLTERHARALLKLQNEEVIKFLIKKIVDKELNVKKTEEIVALTLEKIEEMKKPKVPKAQQKIKRGFNDIRIFTNTVKQSVDVIRKAGLDVKYDMKELEDSYEIHIKIPFSEGMLKKAE